jgi:hypothetical protein
MDRKGYVFDGQPQYFVMILVGIAVFLGIATIIVGNLVHLDWSPSAYETYRKCCGNATCTDTWYDNKTDMCVLSECENIMIVVGGLNRCRYKPTG